MIISKTKQALFTRNAAMIAGMLSIFVLYVIVAQLVPADRFTTVATTSKKSTVAVWQQSQETNSHFAKSRIIQTDRSHWKLTAPYGDASKIKKSAWPIGHTTAVAKEKAS